MQQQLYDRLRNDLHCVGWKLTHVFHYERGTQSIANNSKNQKNQIELFYSSPKN